MDRTTPLPLSSLSASCKFRSWSMQSKAGFRRKAHSANLVPCTLVSDFKFRTSVLCLPSPWKPRQTKVDAKNRVSTALLILPVSPGCQVGLWWFLFLKNNDSYTLKSSQPYLNKTESNYHDTESVHMLWIMIAQPLSTRPRIFSEVTMVTCSGCWELSLSPFSRGTFYSSSMRA